MNNFINLINPVMFMIAFYAGLLSDAKSSTTSKSGSPPDAFKNGTSNNLANEIMEMTECAYFNLEKQYFALLHAYKQAKEIESFIKGKERDNIHLLKTPINDIKYIIENKELITSDDEDGLQPFNPEIYKHKLQGLQTLKLEQNQIIQDGIGRLELIQTTYDELLNNCKELMSFYNDCQAQTLPRSFREIIYNEMPL